jgi:hypothetical protein
MRVALPIQIARDCVKAAKAKMVIESNSFFPVLLRTYGIYIKLIAEQHSGPSEAPNVLLFQAKERLTQAAG